MKAKVGIEFEDKNFLFIINKAASLQNNIDAICEQNSLEPSHCYGLKFTYTTNDLHLDNYVTEENFQQIQDGSTLKLVESLDSIIDRIFPNMVYERQQTFDELFSLSTDPGFIKALVNKGRHKDVLQWLTDKYLTGKELIASLRTLLHLLKKQYINELDNAIVSNITRCVKNDCPPTPPNELQHSLAVLCQILYLRGYEVNKQLIISEISIDDLIPFIWSQDHAILQLNTMMLINAMVKTVKGEKRLQLVKELNKTKNKEYIFNHIIRENVDDAAMAHELYSYQTYILSLYSEAFNTPIDSNNVIQLRELCEDDSDRFSFMAPDDVAMSRSNSVGTILEDTENTRISFASMESERSSNFEHSSNLALPADDYITRLTFDCLSYYKKYHYKSFCQTRLEENTYEPGIYISSERITRMLGKLLHIGREPLKTGISYHPLAFNANLKRPFLLELFSRTMWLLSKTRKEMNAWILDDYPKILTVIEKQIQMVLDKKPSDYKMLIKSMISLTYEEVHKQWQREKEAEWKALYQSNPSVQAIKKEFRAANEKLIFERKIKTLQKGDAFPKLPEKRGKQQHFFLRLSDNKRTVFWGDCDESLGEFGSKDPERFNISDIKHFVTGKACPHVKDNSVKTPERAFSLILESDAVINFLAKDTNAANSWIDGFSLLLGKPHRSADYKNELETLTEMDCALHLLDLQNIPIPNTPPKIPPLPSPIRPKPAVPPKSPNLKLRKSISPLYIRQNSNI